MPSTSHSLAQEKQKDIFFAHSFIVVQIQLTPFSSHQSPHPSYSHLPPGSYPIWFCPCVIYTCSSELLPPFPPIIPTDLPCGCCQFLLYFTVSGYIWPASLFCSLGSPYRGDHIVFVFHRLPCFT